MSIEITAMDLTEPMYVVYNFYFVYFKIWKSPKFNSVYPSIKEILLQRVKTNENKEYNQIEKKIKIKRF